MQVGGGQRQLVAVGRARLAGEHGVDDLVAEDAVPQAADDQDLQGTGGAVAAYLGWGPAVAGQPGEHDQVGQRAPLVRGRLGRPVGAGVSVYSAALQRNRAVRVTRAGRPRQARVA